MFYCSNMSENNIWNFTSNAEGRHIWQLVNGEGVLLGQSFQSFVSKASAEYNSKLLGNNSNFAKQLIWDFFEEDGLWFWTTFNSISKEMVGKSNTGYEAKIDAVNNAANFGFDSSEYIIDTKVTNSINRVSSAITEPTNSFIPNIKTDDLFDIGITDSIEASTETPLISIDSKSNLKRTVPDTSYENDSLDIENKNNGDFGKAWKWLLPVLIILTSIWVLSWFFLGNKNTYNKTNVTNLPATTQRITQNSNLNILGQPEFETINYALRVSGLEKSLNTLGPLTLLAPVNTAFEKLPKDIITELLKPEKINDLQNLLKSHILLGNIELSKVSDDTVLQTISGELLTIKVVDDKLNIGNVKGVDPKSFSAQGNIFVYNLPDVILISEKSNNEASTSIEPSTESFGPG
jgi:uncharacterized surface protein with fasciclin (FAS1) repeats